MADTLAQPVGVDDFAKNIESALHKETQDVKTYVNMMKQEDRKGNREWASGFYYMAKDEYTHVIFLYEVLEEYGATINDSTKKMYNDFVEEYGNMFQ